ncbi:RNA-binding protein 7-like [Suncus etruscus]|uniref:RNA-binding protein 7-like n=1 Tax=Suncus etruscus TaxID=109475 RepID=UPI00210FF296|nr:RNA-binding protein 7-like [Suncus etruscus]
MSPSTQMSSEIFLTPENFQGQIVMDNILRQMSYDGKFDSPHLDQSGFSPSVQSHSHSYYQSSKSQWLQDIPASQHKVRLSSHPYIADRHYSHEQQYPDCKQCYGDHSSNHHYRGSRYDFFH